MNFNSKTFKYGAVFLGAIVAIFLIRQLTDAFFADVSNLSDISGQAIGAIKKEKVEH